MHFLPNSLTLKHKIRSLANLTTKNGHYSKLMIVFLMVNQVILSSAGPKPVLKSLAIPFKTANKNRQIHTHLIVKRQSPQRAGSYNPALPRTSLSYDQLVKLQNLNPRQHPQQIQTQPASTSVLGNAAANIDYSEWISPIFHKDYDIPEEKIISLPIGRFPEPQCEYKLLDSRGEVLRSVDEASFDERLYHSWKCHPENQSEQLYCMSVTDCVVSNGGHTETLFDENSCSVWTSLFPTSICYKNGMEAFVRGPVFKLVGGEDDPVHFTCQINIHVKDNDRCPRPRCDKYEQICFP